MKHLVSIAVLLAALPAAAQQVNVNTTCNLRYNNRGIIHADVPCSAVFTAGRLRRVAFVFPSNRVRYDWTVGQPGVSADPRWAECLRHTAASGNQWQACTVPSFDQLPR